MPGILCQWGALKTVFNVARGLVIADACGRSHMRSTYGAENTAFAVADDQQREHVRQTRVKVRQGMHRNFLAGPEGLAHQAHGAVGPPEAPGFGQGLVQLMQPSLERGL